MPASAISEVPASKFRDPGQPEPGLIDLLRPLGEPLRRLRGLIALTILAGWGKFVLPLAIPLITGYIFDRLIDGAADPAVRNRQLMICAGLTAATLGLMGVATYFRSALSQRLAALFQYRLRKRMFFHIQRLSMGFFSQHHAGSLGSRVSSDINHAAVLINKGIVQWAMDLPLFLIIAGYMIITQPVLGGVAVAMFLINAATLRHLGPPLRRQRRAIQDCQSGVTGRAAEMFAGISVIKAFAGEGASDRRFKDASKQVRDLQWVNSTLQGRFQATNHTVVMLVQMVVLFGGGWLVINTDTLSPGQLVAFLMLLNHIKGAVQRLTDSIMEIQDGFAACERMHDILQISPTPADHPAAVTPPIAGGLTFQDVTFGYGRSSALVGPSGSVKTTLAQLMLRFYDPTSGRILADGTPLQRILKSHYRGQVAAVLQDPIIFSTTVHENIAFADPDAPDQQVVAAARAAQAHDFIADLPDGYASPMGERGVAVSGGQRQRIAIARALMRDPKLLILDEATSALDTVTERSIQEVIDGLQGSRTVVVIAHRLSTVRNVDEILVMDHGRLIEHGSYDELMARGGAFTRLAAEQTENAA